MGWRPRLGDQAVEEGLVPACDGKGCGGVDLLPCVEWSEEDRDSAPVHTDSLRDAGQASVEAISWLRLRRGFRREASLLFCTGYQLP